MERLTLEEIIDHCKRKTESLEKYTRNGYLETAPIESNVVREYWEHKQVAGYLQELLVYRELEGQGKLLKLLIPLGVPVYAIQTIYKCSDSCIGYGTSKCDEGYPCEYQELVCVIHLEKFEASMIAEWGKTVFATKEEAEARLKEINERR